MVSVISTEVAVPICLKVGTKIKADKILNKLDKIKIVEKAFYS